MNEKRFSLFNSGRWHANDLLGVQQLHVVPVLYAGEFTSDQVDHAMHELNGYSVAAPGYEKPEGIIVFHSQIKEMFKVTFEHDDTGKNFGA